MKKVSAKKVRSMVKKASASSSTGATGACIIVRRPGTVVQCAEITKAACDIIHEELDNANAGFASFRGAGTKC